MNEDTSLNEAGQNNTSAQQVIEDEDVRAMEMEHAPKEITIDKRSKPELYYIVALVFCTLIVLALSITLIVVASSNKPVADKAYEAGDNSNITKSITVLLISDIHESTDNVVRVGEYIDSNGIEIDHLWVSGDFMNLNEENQNENELPQAEATLLALLATLRTIHPKPVIIAGNHDPKTLFWSTNETYRTFGDCLNIHKQLHAVEGEDNLFMAGFGGSVPAYSESKQIWDGYPFTTDAEYGAQYNAFIHDVLIRDGDHGIGRSVILFNHVGPLLSSTSEDWRYLNISKRITSGSEHITNAILHLQLKGKILCCIHGHAHLGVGQSRIGAVKIINPGCSRGFMDSNIDPCNAFALLHLIQFEDKSWDIKDVQFIAL